MKNCLIKILIVLSATFAMIGCNSGSDEEVIPTPTVIPTSIPTPVPTINPTSTPVPTPVPTVNPTPIPTPTPTPEASSSTLTQELKDSITYMYSEEGLAYDIYMNIYKIQAVNQLQNIATKSEVKHIEAVNQLAIKYDLNITQYPDTDVPYSIDDMNKYGSGEYPVDPIQHLYTLLYEKGIQSRQDALEVGCMVEVVDIDDLDKYIIQAQASNAADVLSVFNFLRDGSYTHYWAFDEGLKNMGITDGCCSLAPQLGHDYCHPEYPQGNNAGGGSGGGGKGSK